MAQIYVLAAVALLVGGCADPPTDAEFVHACDVAAQFRWQEEDGGTCGSIEDVDLSMKSSCGAGIARMCLEGFHDYTCEDGRAWQWREDPRGVIRLDMDNGLASCRSTYLITPRYILLRR